MQMMNKQKKKQAIRELSLLTDNIGWDSDAETVARVEALGTLLKSDNISESAPLPDIDFEKFTPDNYLYLKYLGYTNNAIRKACGIYNSKLNAWIKENELSRGEISTEDLAQWEFTERSKRLPLKGVETLPIITNEKINQFLQDGGWAPSTQSSYSSQLDVFMEYMENKELSKSIIDSFLLDIKRKYPRSKFSSIKSIVLKYLKWVGFDYQEKRESKAEMKKTKKDKKTVAAPIVDQTIGEEGANATDIAVIVDETEKVCVMVGKAFLRVNPEATVVNLSLDHEVASDLSEKKEIAQQIAADYGGRLVKINTRTIMSDID